MDSYNERLISTKPSIGSIIGMVLAIILTLGGVALLLLSPPLGLLILCGGIALIIFLKEGLSVEYEFILTNGDIEVAKIYGKKRRREINTIESSNIAQVRRTDDERVANDISISKYKIVKYLGRDKDIIPTAVYYGEGDGQVIYLFDLDDKCYEHLKRYADRT